jgi:hypothetical protein
VRRVALIVCVLVSGCGLAHERSDREACMGLSPPAHPLGAPMHHRAIAADCPSSRGAIASSPACDATSDPTCPEADCVTDADCVDGPNGRCSHLHRGPANIRLFCTYDACANDDGCTGGPCSCRDSAASAEANRCFDAGNCRVDADCGAGGYCSPSLIGFGFCECPTEDLCVDAGDGTGCFVSYDGGLPIAVRCVCGNTCAAPGFYCHTPCDECTNDTDCAGGSCLFDAREHRWACRLALCGSGP